MHLTCLVITSELPSSVLLINELQQQQYQLVTINRGRSALRLFNSIKPDLVFVDSGIKDMDCCDVVQQLSKSQIHNKCLLVPICSADEKAHYQNALQNSVVLSPLLTPLVMTEVNNKITDVFEQLSLRS